MRDTMFKSLTVCACSLLIISCVGIKESGTTVDDKTTVDQFTASFQRAYNAHDPALVADLYAADARWMAAAGLVIEGRLMITAFLQQFMTFVPPVLTLTEGDKVVVGDYAVTRGTYTMSAAAGGKGRSIGGSYLNVLHRDGEQWQIVSQQMNYDFAMSPFMWVGSLDALEARAEAGSLMDLLEAYEAGYNIGDAATVAALFTEDAWVSFGGSSPVSGREAAAQALQGQMAEGTNLALHDVSTLVLDDGTAVDVGWYELGADGDRIQWGTYTLLAQQNSAGEWRIRWFIDTGSPLSANTE